MGTEEEVQEEDGEMEMEDEEELNNLAGMWRHRGGSSNSTGDNDGDG